MADVQLSGEADADLVDIGNYGARVWGIDAAADFVTSFYDAFEMLERHPDIGRPRTDVHEELRSWLHRGYMIFYTRKGDVVTIRRVVHGATDVPTIFPAP